MQKETDPRGILIGCMLTGGLELSRKILSQVEREDFGGDHYGKEFVKCYDVINELVSSNSDFDAVLVADELSRRGVKNAYGFVSLCEAMVIAPSLYPAYIRKVREIRLKREFEDILKKIDSMSIDEIFNKVAKLSPKLISKSKIKQVADVIEPLVDRLEDKKGPDFNFSLEALNLNVGGLNKGELMVVGAWTSQGKSSLLINLALDLSVRHKVLFCSSEMTEEELARRLLAYSCNIPVVKLRRSFVTDDEIQVIKETLSLFKDFELYMVIVHSLGDIIEAVEKIEPEVVFVDHLHHLTGEGNREYEIVSNNIKGLQELAIRKNIGVVVAAQLHRKEEGRVVRPPRIDDLRASGQIEENAQMIVLLFWEWQITNGESGDKNIIECRLVKNRDGTIGKFKVFWDPEVCKFTDLKKKEGKYVEH